MWEVEEWCKGKCFHLYPTISWYFCLFLPLFQTLLVLNSSNLVIFWILCVVFFLKNVVKHFLNNFILICIVLIVNRSSSGISDITVIIIYQISLFTCIASVALFSCFESFSKRGYFSKKAQITQRYSDTEVVNSRFIYMMI